jgi:hypothetical protein
MVAGWTAVLENGLATWPRRIQHVDLDPVQLKQAAFQLFTATCHECSELTARAISNVKRAPERRGHHRPLYQRQVSITGFVW